MQKTGERDPPNDAKNTKGSELEVRNPHQSFLALFGVFGGSFLFGDPKLVAKGGGTGHAMARLRNDDVSAVG